MSGGRALYIVAGLRSAALKKSSWAAHLQSGPGLSRKQVIELYQQAVVNDAALMQRLWELGGATLMCQCTPAQYCHGDVLIRLSKG